jgi:5-methylcytosine-specific restriction protein A
VPDLSLRACAQGRCPELVVSGYCANHGGNSERAAGRKRFDDARGTAASRGYDAVWQRLRLVVLREEPVCRKCQRALSREVDHIVPIAAGGERLERSNLQGLCKPCHSRKTATEDSAFARSGPLPPKGVGGVASVGGVAPRPPYGSTHTPAK